MSSAPSAPTDAQRYEALRTVRDRLPRLAAALALEATGAEQACLQTLDSRLLPRLSPDFPLIAAITGGGSAGKSTLFNSLVGADISTAGGRAGLNRRVLVGVHPRQLDRPDFLSELFRPFGALPQPLGDDKQALTTPGAPLYAAHESLPERLILLDTPDFDVGVGGEFLNRAVAEPVLTAADVLVYIFTNATYNAKANTDFIRDQLTRIGRRPCILIYRVYASFTDADVQSHSQTVAENLYGADWQPNVLGIFRADDDNAVASGAAPMVPRRLDGPGGLLDALHALNPRALREAMTAAMIADVASAARAFAARAAAHRDLLELYRDGLRLAEGHAIAGALAHFPLDTVVERIRAIFERTDSGFLRFSRKVGRVTGAPLRGLMRLVGGKDDAAEGKLATDPAELTRSALVESANALRRQTLAEELTVATTHSDPGGHGLLQKVARVRHSLGLQGAARPLAEHGAAGGATNLFLTVPEALREARQALTDSDWSAALEAISARADALLELPATLDAELETIVMDFRKDLPFVKKARAALFASLNVVPPVLAIAYVFATVDPVGGTTLAAKMHSVFGLNDLWATVSIPASSGLDDATKRHLKRLLDPVVQRWLASRAAPVSELFRARITGAIIDAAQQRLTSVSPLLEQLEAALDQLHVGQS